MLVVSALHFWAALGGEEPCLHGGHVFMDFLCAAELSPVLVPVTALGLRPARPRGSRRTAHGGCCFYSTSLWQKALWKSRGEKKKLDGSGHVNERLPVNAIKIVLGKGE